MDGARVSLAPASFRVSSKRDAFFVHDYIKLSYHHELLKQILFRVCTKYLGFGFLNFLCVFFFVFFFAFDFPPLFFFLSTPFFVRRDERGGERKRRPSPDDDDDDDDDDEEEAERKKNQPPFFFSSSFSSFDVRSLDALGSF